MIAMVRLKAEIRLLVIAAGLVAMCLWLATLADGSSPRASAMSKQVHDGRTVSAGVQN